jgi:hypothetical protein
MQVIIHQVLITNTETWDGTAWTEVSDVNTGRWAFGGSGTQSDALAILAGGSSVYFY